MMERTSAASSMEWSVDLEKGLRSVKSGQSLEAILRAGLRLELWDREPAINMSQYNMFGLIPGEDKLFANSILLRLAGAFSSGDQKTKLYVVKVFLSLMRNRRKRRGQNHGILFKCSLENRLELIRRIKIVLDTGNVESRALALVLFGCWADLVKDSPAIRYLVLSSLVSCDVLQVEASLFAGSCFCELSSDFASIFMEILVNILSASETLSALRVAGGRAFAKLRWSSTHINKAYEAGLKLVLGSSDEDFLDAMLISLSKLASKSAQLIHRQVDLLFSFLTQDKPLQLRATTLSCLHYIIAKRTFDYPASADSIKILVTLLAQPELPPALQNKTLQILRKVLLSGASADMPEFSEVLKTVASQSPIMVIRLSAYRVLVDLSTNLLGRKETTLDGFDPSTFSGAVQFIINQIKLLKHGLHLHQHDSDFKQEIHSLFQHLLHLLEMYSSLSEMMLENIMMNMVNIHDQIMGPSEPVVSGDQIIVSREQNKKLIASNLLRCVSKVVVACLERLSGTGVVTSQVLDTVELLIERVDLCGWLDLFTRSSFCFLLRSHITCCYILKEIEENEPVGSFSIPLQDHLVQHEILTLESAKNMLAKKDNWSSYKLGRYAACQGAWFTAAFIFEHLLTFGQSDTFSLWLKALAGFAHSEKKVRLLDLPNKGSSLVNWLETNRTVATTFKHEEIGIGQGTDWKLGLPDNTKHLIEACDILRASDKDLGQIVTSSHRLYFQRWFLALRAKVLQSVVDTLQLFYMPLLQNSVDNDSRLQDNSVIKSWKVSQWVTSMACSLTRISLQLNGLAREFDLITTSFRDLDENSLDILSAHALSCSLLALSTGFSLFFPKLQAEDDVEKSDKCLHGMLIQDLLWRLQLVDCETNTKLVLLSRVCTPPKNSFLQSRNQVSHTSYEVRGLLKICSDAVTGLVVMQNEVTGGNDDELLHQVAKDGLQLLLDVMLKWMCIPFRTPSYFFTVRPCIYSELFASSSETRSSNKISVLSGSHLSLDLCLQLKNMPPDLPFKMAKLYCILHCTKSCQASDPGSNGEKDRIGYQGSGTDDMVCLNDKLLQYISRSTKNASYAQHNKRSAGDCGVDVFVCLEPNEKGQGFSTCLLDVSSFPVGTYRIKWHSSFVDKNGSYWSLLPLNPGPFFTVVKLSP